jgi:hypothetical protein
MFGRRPVKEAAMTSQFANEEVASSCTYSVSYKLKGVTEQANRLRELFPGIPTDLVTGLVGMLVPAIMEGCFVIPRWETIAGTYNEAVEKVLALIGSTRKLYNYREGGLGLEHLRQSTWTTYMLRKLSDRQGGHDLLFVPAQFGLRYRGRSIRRAREVFAGNEFGLGAFATGIMFLTHPERLEHYENLWIDCAGDEYAPEADGAFSCAPFWYFCDGELRFDARGLGAAGPCCGSASACLPE